MFKQITLVLSLTILTAFNANAQADDTIIDAKSPIEQQLDGINVVSTEKQIEARKDFYNSAASTAYNSNERDLRDLVYNTQLQRRKLALRKKEATPPIKHVNIKDREQVREFLVDQLPNTETPDSLLEFNKDPEAFDPNVPSYMK